MLLLDSVPAGETWLNGPNGDFYRLFNLPAPILRNRSARDRELNFEMDLQDSSSPVSRVFLGTVCAGVEAVLSIGDLNPNLTFRGIDAGVRMM
jgi:hypothetical protein